MTLREEAARWIVLIEASLVSIPDIIAWADTRIAACEKPNAVLIDLSTCRPDDYHQIVGLLAQLRHDISPVEALRLAARGIRDAILSGRISAEAAAHFTYSHLAGQRDIPSGMQPLVVADDRFYLAINDQYGDLDTIRRDFLDALSNAENA